MNLITYEMANRRKKVSSIKIKTYQMTCTSLTVRSRAILQLTKTRHLRVITIDCNNRLM